MLSEMPDTKEYILYDYLYEDWKLMKPLYGVRNESGYSWSKCFVGVIKTDSSGMLVIFYFLI